MSGDVVGMAERREDAEREVLQATCANPRCDEQFLRTVGPGRRKEFHSEDCRRAAERDYRRLTSRLEHYERQAEQMRSRLDAYLRTNVEEGVAERTGPSTVEISRAREAIAEVRGMALFLPQHQGEFAQHLLNLFEAVEPLVPSGRS